MSDDLDPVVGGWYRNPDTGELLKVIAVDPDSEVVELQHLDGDLEEFDASAWNDLKLEPAEPPEDWTDAADDVESDDLGYEYRGETLVKNPPTEGREDKDGGEWSEGAAADSADDHEP
jgi:uncharacterized protein DUF6763